MMDSIKTLLGLDLDPQDLSLMHVSLRAVIVFIASLIIVRVGDRRFLAKMSAVDVILGFVLASMLARAVNGSAAFFPTLGGAFVMILLHRAFVIGAFHSRTFDNLVKGREKLIVDKGRVLPEVMRSHRITENDLLEEMRQEGNVDSLDKVKCAVVERSGRISVVYAESETTQARK